MYIGIDLGGTNIAGGVLDEKCKILKKLSVPTNAGRSFEKIISDMADLINRLIKDSGLSLSDIKAIGVGTPGALDHSAGIVLNAGNLGWKNADLRGELKKYFDLPISIENDANAAAYGEYAVRGEDIDNMIFVTLGTGVGGGIIIDKKIYRGFNGAGAEIGHITLVHGGVRCSCGKAGCWEAYASVSALIGQTEDAIKAHPDSLMAKLYKDTGVIDGKTSFTAAKAGDPAAANVVSTYIDYVADGICSLVNIFEPEVLLIGGGISKEGSYLLDPIIEYCEKNYFCKNIRQTKLAIASLGGDAGIVGAAMAAAAELR